MRKYLHVIRISLFDALEYRMELFIRVLGWGFRLVISLFLWFTIIEAKGGSVGGYAFEDMLIYFFLVQMIASFIFNDSGFDINRDIHYGDFSNYLVKPIRYLPFRYATEFSYNITRSIIGLVLFGILLAFIRPEFYATLFQAPDRLLLFLIALFLAQLINFHIIAMIACAAFWLTTSQRLLFVYFGIINILSGLIIPLDLFPEKAFAILRFLPFPYLFFFPLQIIMKPEISAIEFAGTVLLPQIAFGGILFFLLASVYNIGLKHHEAVGK